MTEPSLPPPGWYPDPSGAAMQRYFDGTDPSDMAGHDVEPLRGLVAASGLPGAVAALARPLAPGGLLVLGLHAGAARIRHALRPLISWGESFQQDSGAVCAAGSRIHVCDRCEKRPSRVNSQQANRSKAPALNQPDGVLDLTSAPHTPLNRLRQQWREKRPTFGAIATIPSIQTVQIMARSGIDWIIVDLEHGPIDLGSAHAMITATSGTPCVPMVRIAANEPWLAKAPMDLGALGINFPMICSRADAEKAVRSVRYPPKGDRLWGPFHAPFRWGVSMPDYMATVDDDMICMITIEHVEAVNRIDEIMATPGIDLAVIGPGDLATSINKRGLPDDPQVVALMQRAEEGILKSGVPIGGVARTAEQANQMIERGYLALALGFDWSLFQRGIAASFAGIKR